MMDYRHLVLAIVVSMGFCSLARAQQIPQAVPNQPFKTVHLIVVSPAQEAALIAAVEGYNRAFVGLGCSTCSYHIFKMFKGARDKYNYMMTSDWPSQGDYLKIHNSADYDVVTKRNPVMADIYQDEFYGRYVEVH